MKNLIKKIRDIYGQDFVPLHRPIFDEEEKNRLLNCIDSNFVSSVGQYVIDFETNLSEFTGAKFSAATVNGTSGLHAALLATGVRCGDEVLTQALTFVATSNAISYCSARPVFIDVDLDTLGLSPEALLTWLKQNVVVTDDGLAINKITKARVSACLPMHTFGLPCRIQEITDICGSYNIPLVEDSAEALGSYVGTQHVGTFGNCSVISFNGNKIITTGGGGMFLTSDFTLYEKVKKQTTTSKVEHEYEYYHDQVGFNYRMPNLNAALGIAQMSKLDRILEIKGKIAAKYREFFDGSQWKFIEPLEGTTSNFWLNAILCKTRNARDKLLSETNQNGIMTRPIWCLMTSLPMYRNCQHDGLKNSWWLADRVVNLPSSVPDSNNFGDRCEY